MSVPNFAAQAKLAGADSLPTAARSAGHAQTQAQPQMSYADRMGQAAMFLSGDDRAQAQAIAGSAAVPAPAPTAPAPTAPAARAGAGAAHILTAPAAAGRTGGRFKLPARGSVSGSGLAASGGGARGAPMTPQQDIHHNLARLTNPSALGLITKGIGYANAVNFKAINPRAGFGAAGTAAGANTTQPWAPGARFPGMQLASAVAAASAAAGGSSDRPQSALAAFETMRKTFTQLRFQRQNQAMRQKMGGRVGAVFGRGPVGGQSRFPAAAGAGAVGHLDPAAAKAKAAAEAAAALSRAKTGLGRRTGMFGAAGAGAARSAFGKTASLRAALKRAGAAGRLLQSKRVIIRDDMSVRDLADACGVKPGRLIAKLNELGESAKASDVIDPDVADIVAQELGHRVKRMDSKIKDRMPTEIPDPDVAAAKGYPHRAPVVTVMGHVDHGALSLCGLSAALHGLSNCAAFLQMPFAYVPLPAFIVARLGLPVCLCVCVFRVHFFYCFCLSARSCPLLNASIAWLSPLPSPSPSPSQS